ncbi:hypothetical protein M0805_005546 [Coniferiporia weirii]|nr:hypothetical protein M0805_005546 [Coniferiporia weirii]
MVTLARRRSRPRSAVSFAMSSSNSVALSVIAGPFPSVAEPSGQALVVPGAPDTVAASGPTTEPEQSSSWRDKVPLDAIGSVAIGAAKITAAAAPVPWLGPAVELVVAIVKMCQNVSKNKNAAKKLAEHCSKLLGEIEKRHPNNTAVGDLQIELESLLTKIRDKMEDWTKYSWFRAFVEQETISGAISTFHIEIDQLCKRHAFVVYTEMIYWQTEHSIQTTLDHEELKSFLTNLTNAHELESRCRKEEIAAIREDFIAFFALVQTLLLDLKRDLGQNEPKQCESLESNISAIYRSSGTLPPNIELTEGLTQRKDFPEFGNGMFDIYRGTCFNDVNFQCAFKIVRHVSLGGKTRQHFERQLTNWKSIQKQIDGAREKKQTLYILPLIGVIYRDYGRNPLLCLVSPWMEKGNAVHYVRLHEDTDRLAMIRKIALGIKVLHTHTPPLAHGYIRGSNILIDDLGDPYLSDFGLMRIVEDASAQPMAVSSVPKTAESSRWLPPELMGILGHGVHRSEDDPGHNLTTKSDIFMFGMTVVELMTGERPFYKIEKDHIVTIYRGGGGLPEKPTGEDCKKIRRRGLDERLWEFLERCWANDPADRPTITEVLDFLSS